MKKVTGDGEGDECDDGPPAAAAAPARARHPGRGVRRDHGGREGDRRLLPAARRRLRLRHEEDLQPRLPQGAGVRGGGDADHHAAPRLLHAAHGGDDAARRLRGPGPAAGAALHPRPARLRPHQGRHREARVRVRGVAGVRVQAAAGAGEPPGEFVVIMILKIFAPP